MTAISAYFYGRTDTGRVRSNNEDAFVLQYLWDDSHILSVVIDGIGGHEGGELAAEIAAESIKSHLVANRDGKPLELLKQAVAAANNAIVAAKKGHPEFSKMGCVLSAGIIDLKTRQLNVVHIGDTRLYRISQGEMVKLTHDHSPVGYMEDIGLLTEEEAMSHPHRNVIDRFLGETTHQAGDQDFIDSAIYPISPGDTLLFCSDGLYDMLSSKEIFDAVSGDSQRTVECLVEDAIAKGGLDNVTVIVICLQGGVAVSEEESIDVENPETVKTVVMEQGITDQLGPTGQSGTFDMSYNYGLSGMMPGLWISLLLGGLVIGYALGTYNMSSSLKEIKGSLDAQCLLLDSLRSSLSSVPNDTLSCDALSFTSPTDTMSFENAFIKKQSSKMK